MRGIVAKKVRKTFCSEPLRPQNSSKFRQTVSHCSSLIEIEYLHLLNFARVCIRCPNSSIMMVFPKSSYFLQIISRYDQKKIYDQ